jgi:type I restriction enzyme R subunit
VQSRFESWLAQQQSKGRAFSDEQKQWLGMMRDHIATSLEMDVDDFDLTPFTDEGGLAKASRVFGKELPDIVHELNEALAA